MEYQKSWHAVINPQYAGSCGSWCYNVNDDVDLTVGGGFIAAVDKYNTVKAPFTGANSYQNGFSISQELEVFACKSNNIMMGCNTLGSQIFFEALIESSVSASYIFNYFTLFDCVFIIQD
jgi:hypothetical protein